MSDAPPPHGLGIVALERLADRGELPARIVPDLAVGEVDDLFLGHLEPFHIRLGDVLDADGSPQECLQIIQRETGSREVPFSRRMPPEGRRQSRADRRSQRAR